MNKVWSSPDEAIRDIFDGASIAFGGFFTAGAPVHLIQALIRLGAKELTIITQDVGVGTRDIDELVLNGQVKKVICNYPFFRSPTRGARSPFEQAVRAGEIEVEVNPMGTFVERLRAAGAGIPAFYTPTGVGTVVAEGKEVRSFNGKVALLETALQPDFAFVHAYRGDREGNLVYRKTAMNYNPTMAAAARITIAEVESLVDPGEIDSMSIHTPGIYVQRLVKVDRLDIVPGID